MADKPQLPKDWTIKPISSLGRVLTGKTPSTKTADNFGGHIPFMTPSDMDGRRIITHTPRHLTEQGAASVSSARIPRGAVMVSCIGSDMGKAAMAGCDAVTNQQINSIIVGEGISNLYVYYNLSMRKAEIQHIGSGGSAVPILNKGHFSQLQIALPPIEVQEAIACILGALDDKIELNRRMNQTLEAMARAIFKSWFVDFDPVRAKAEGRDTALPDHVAALFPDAFEESELGEIPMGWEVWRVTEAGNVVCGKTPSTRVPEYYGDDVPFIRIPDMHGSVFAATTQKKLSRAGAASQANKALPPGTICVSCIATPGLVVITTEESHTNQQINSVVLRGDNETYYWFWAFRDLAEDIRTGGSGGSVLANLSTGRFSALRVLPATADLRRSYHLGVAPLFERILTNLRETDALAALRDTLLPKLISGELRVPHVERFLARRL